MNTAEVTEVTDETPQHIKGIGIETMLELRDKNLNHGQIAQLLGCDRSNVSRRLAKYKPTFEKITGHKKHRADILTSVQARLLDSVTDEKINDCTVPQLTVAYGILYDKERLERGQSTQNMSVASLIESHSTNLEALSGQIAKITQELDSE